MVLFGKKNPKRSQLTDNKIVPARWKEREAVFKKELGKGNK